MKKSYIVYAVLTVGLFALGVVFAKSTIMIMIDIPSLMLVLAPVILMLLSHYGPKEFVNAFRAAMEKSNSNEHELKNALVFFSTAQKLVIASTAATVFLGIIMILNSIGEGYTDSGKTVAWWMAVDVIAILYAGLLTMVITIPFKSALQKRLNDLKG
ncbi:MAG: hypothetical protein JXA07_05645 [Spirochaetes bacterium]|nr:hypothetical protein [Spirochaetota bacterium]